MNAEIRNRLNKNPLGLEPSELLMMIRVFLIVEGQHDEVVVNRFIEDTLEAARVTILKMRGTDNLTVRLIHR